MSALALMAAEAASAGFTGYIIRNADNGTAPVINASTSNSINATLDVARQKVGFGSNSGISVVPAPGALALLGVAGFASRRRRA